MSTTSHMDSRAGGSRSRCSLKVPDTGYARFPSPMGLWSGGSPPRSAERTPLWHLGCTSTSGEPRRRSTSRTRIPRMWRSASRSRAPAPAVSYSRRTVQSSSSYAGRTHARCALSSSMRSRRSASRELKRRCCGAPCPPRPTGFWSSRTASRSRPSRRRSLPRETPHRAQRRPAGAVATRRSRDRGDGGPRARFAARRRGSRTRAGRPQGIRRGSARVVPRGLRGRGARRGALPMAAYSARARGPCRAGVLRAAAARDARCGCARGGV
jgi:hypothetical protein